MGRRSYVSRVERLGLAYVQEVARQNGRSGGRPKKGDSGLSEEEGGAKPAAVLLRAGRGPMKFGEIMAEEAGRYDPGFDFGP